MNKCSPGSIHQFDTDSLSRKESRSSICNAEEHRISFGSRYKIKLHGKLCTYTLTLQRHKNCIYTRKSFWKWTIWKYLHVRNSNWVITQSWLSEALVPPALSLNWSLSWSVWGVTPAILTDASGDSLILNENLTTKWEESYFSVLDLVN